MLVAAKLPEAKNRRNTYSRMRFGFLVRLAQVNSVARMSNRRDVVEGGLAPSRLPQYPRTNPPIPATGRETA